MLLSQKISRKLWLIAVVILTVIGSPVKTLAYKKVERFKTVDNLSSVTFPTSKSPSKTSVKTSTNSQQTLITQNIIPVEVPNPIMPRNQEQLNPQPLSPTQDNLLENLESAPSNSPHYSESNSQSEPENSQSDSESNSQSEPEIYLDKLQINFEDNTAFTDEELCNWIVNSSEQNKDDENKKNEGNDDFWKRIIDEESDKESCKLAPKDSEKKNHL